MSTMTPVVLWLALSEEEAQAFVADATRTGRLPPVQHRWDSQLAMKDTPEGALEAAESALRHSEVTPRLVLLKIEFSGEQLLCAFFDGALTRTWRRGRAGVDCWAGVPVSRVTCGFDSRL